MTTNPAIERKFWSGRRVFVTGHTGFKGSWLSLWLQDLGAEVVGFALEPPTSPSLFTLADVAAGMCSTIGDIRHFEPLHQALAKARPDVVFHLAAQSLVRQSYAEPIATYATNVLGSAHVLEAVRQTPGVRAVVMITTDKCYENREWVWPYREDDPMGGHDPYSSSKGCAELVTAAYRRSFFTAPGSELPLAAVASARAGNVIGGGDWAQDRLIPDVVRGVLAGETIHIRSPHAIRPWQHVLDPLAGYLRLAERLVQDGDRFAEAWNFGPEEGDTQSVGWIVEQLVERWGPEARWTRDEAAHPHEAKTLKLDSSKARTVLGWRPRLPLPKALDWVVEGYRAFAEEADLRALVWEQIRRYERL